MRFLKDLNPVQREAVETGDGPVLIVAGAGSGKTRVLTYRIVYLLHSGVQPWNMLALTFTNKAAREMQDRIRLLVGDEADRIWMGTFHSMFSRILRREADKLGYSRNFSIYDADDSLGLIKSLMNAQNMNADQFAPRAVRNRISRAKNAVQGPEEFSRAAVDFLDQKIAPLYHAYQEQLRGNNAMDFDDLIMQPIVLFERHPDVLEKYQERFRHILIDEYQDTNRAQYLLVNTLAAKYRNIYAVGDDAQSIYAFRGADIRNILDFRNDYKNARLVRLEQNYRSTGHILAGADAVIRRNKDQIAKKLWTENPEGNPITIVECLDESDEAMKIVHLIQEQCRKHKFQLHDFAVLYRINAQSRAIEDGLRRAGIPYVIVGGTAFYQRKEIKDILAYLRLIVNPADNESLLRILNVPARGIGATTQKRLKDFAAENGISLLEAIRRVNEIWSINAGIAGRVAQFGRLITKYIALRSEMSAGELARSLVDGLELIPLLKMDGTPESQARIENIQELLSAITDYDAREGDDTLDSFLAEASLVAEIDMYDSNSNAVTLMTLHAAKGLEFPSIIIAGVEEGLLPSNMSRQNDEIEEERRLFYVGMTRAQRELHITRARYRMVYGERLEQIPSRFLEEIDEEHVRTIFSTRTRSRNGNQGRRKPARPQRANTRSQYDQETASSYSQEAEIYVGQDVYHPTFGRGRVVTLKGTGVNMRADVDFDSVGKKTLVLRYAGLRPA